MSSDTGALLSWKQLTTFQGTKANKSAVKVHERERGLKVFASYARSRGWALSEVITAWEWPPLREV